MPTQSLGTSPEVAAYLGLKPRTLAQWRWQGKGPRWHKVGSEVRYRWTDVEKWLNQQAQGGSAA